MVKTFTGKRLGRLLAAGMLAAVCAFGVSGCADLNEADLENMTEADVKNAIEGFFDDLQSGKLFRDLQALSDSSATSTGATASSDTQTEGYAAIVNGTEISQQSVTDYIQSFREYSGLEDDEYFASWMAAYGYDPESLFDETVSIFINQTLIEQAAEDLGVRITSSEVDQAIDNVKEEMAVTSDAQWQQLLEENGLTEESYREQVEMSLEEEQMMLIIGEGVTASDEEIVSYFQTYYENYADITSVDEIEPEILAQAQEDVDMYAKSLVYYDYMDAFSAASEIVFGEMPADAPYNIDMDAYQTTTEATGQMLQLD